MARPDRIGRLHVERPLGAGGFATVWLAHDPDLDDAVAVKVLAENWTAHAEIRRRFVDEARLLRRVDSDHLVRVYDIGELPDGRPYFVMTHADRGSLAERTARRPTPWASADVLGVVDAVGLAVLLGDLGIAKDLRWASGIPMPAGSDRYLPPEQRASSDRIGPSSDVHALAVTAGQLLGLTAPWPGSPVGQVLQRATWPDAAGRTTSVAGFAAQLRSALGPAASTAPGRWRRRCTRRRPSPPPDLSPPAPATLARHVDAGRGAGWCWGRARRRPCCWPGRPGGGPGRSSGTPAARTGPPSTRRRSATRPRTGRSGSRCGPGTAHRTWPACWRASR